MYVLNLAMRTYRQIDVVPAYESLALIFNIVAGLALFGESALYSWQKLAYIWGSFFVILLGIIVLAFKHNILHAKELEQQSI